MFRDGTPVRAEQARSVLKICLTNLGLNPSNYGIHCFRVGRTSDLIKYDYSIEEVKKWDDGALIQSTNTLDNKSLKNYCLVGERFHLIMIMATFKRTCCLQNYSSMF